MSPSTHTHIHTEVEPSRHKCLIYDGHPAEQLPVVIPFLTDGLQNNWRCFYLGSPEMIQMIDSSLEGHGVQASQEVHRGALVMSSDRSYLAGGEFNPRMLADMLGDLVDESVQDGFQGLCATGDMVWELGADKNFERLLEYEALLEQLFRDKPLRGICQYQRTLIPAPAIRDALLTHRSMYMGDQLNQDNLFYIPPELLLETRGDTTAGKQGEWMCQQMIRVMQAERKRDTALIALKRSEEKQRKLAGELTEVNGHLEQRVAERTRELEAVNQHLESFSYSVSHDLRAPLRTVLGFSEILSQECNEALGAEGRQHLSRVVAGGRRMEELIEGLLMLSKMERSSLRRVSIDVSAMAEEVMREVREADPKRASEISIQSGLRVTGDRVLIRAVLTNLLANAWKFTSKVPSARIEVGEKEDGSGEKIFFVQDNGAGFDMQMAEKLFGPFQRLHKEQDFPGTGIGLATVQRIITRHGGRIWAEGRPNKGATIFFTIPEEQYIRGSVSWRTSTLN
jgi:signal transduction histidine kinase